MQTLDRAFLPMFTAIVLIQGVHVIEHVIQLMQVYLFGVAEDNALGFLGYFIQFNDTEEWLHFAFNATFLLALFALTLPMRRRVPQPIPFWAFAVFVVGALGLETWHVVEHTVIIANVIKNSGCPCPGIGDVALGISDTQLHFVYNAIAYLSTVVPFWFLMKRRVRTTRLTTATA